MRRTRDLAVATGVATGVGAAALTTASPTGGSGTATISTAASPASSPGTPAASGPVQTISGFSFSTLSVKAGASVNVTNKDSVTHTVKVSGTSVDVTVPAAGQATFTATAKARSYALGCDFHAQMNGILTVTA
jgi:plastocyanin